MINKNKIIYNEPIYYIPNYSKTANKVKLIKCLNNDKMLVQIVVNKGKKESKPFTIPIQHIFNKPEDARFGAREWENYMRKKNKNKSKKSYAKLKGV